MKRSTTIDQCWNEWRSGASRCWSTPSRPIPTSTSSTGSGTSSTWSSPRSWRRCRACGWSWSICRPGLGWSWLRSHPDSAGHDHTLTTCAVTGRICSPTVSGPTSTASRSSTHRLIGRRWSPLQRQGSEQFFLGTDSAPHPASDKYAPTAKPGIFNAPFALPVVAEVFHSVGALGHGSTGSPRDTDAGSTASTHPRPGSA